MEKSTVYLETTVIGHLASKLVGDPVVAGRQISTREWWQTASHRFRLVVSRLVEEECAAGDPVAAAERLALLKSLEYLLPSPQATTLAQALIDRRAIPASEPRDAAHVSLAAVNGIQYLATWNFSHIANPVTRGRIEQVCRDLGLVPPVICTPDELAGVSDETQPDQ